MNANKKTRNKHKSSKRSPVKKATPIKRVGAKKKPVTKRRPGAKKKLATKGKLGGKKKLATKRKPARQKLVKSRKAPKRVAQKKLRPRRARAVITLTPDEIQTLDDPVITSARIGRGSGGQSGDLQGLSDAERADSESVEELLEEGNAFEAGVLIGVQDADDGNLEEVQTHQVPEDDVPREYLDND